MPSYIEKKRSQNVVWLAICKGFSFFIDRSFGTGSTSSTLWDRNFNEQIIPQGAPHKN